MGRTEYHDDQEAEEDEKPESKRVDLSLSQVAGAGAATLAAATAASYLNVYGTVIGAAVMATLSTLASPFLQEWFSRSGTQARQFAEKTVRYTDPTGTGSPRPGAHPLDPPGTGPIPGVPPTGPIPGLPEDLDATRTMALPVQGLEDPTGRFEAFGEDDARGGATVVHEDPDGPGSGDAPPVRRGRRLVFAAVVFALVMLAILVFELFTGRSLTAWTQGQDESTSPTLFGGDASVSSTQEDGTDTGTEEGTDGDPEEDVTGWTPEGPTDGATEPAPDTDGTAPPTEDGEQTDPGAQTPEGGTTTPPPAEEEEGRGTGEPQPESGTGDQGSGGTENAVPPPAASVG
ncbi:hypothetical protein PWG71_21070 [Nocardiopsis sp. N85]|uniref:hypothetical protein n=1 Tax=Nocardiopsis sp. N85 TaxID=3029400 RepID=UPI00237FAF0B|nr:hypothetical protein [Nocardiopsis sp. N85]MDE3723890.1 hypothetical protein [Nocardiopsis sp. N85]